jgi:hypothetical protein
MICEWQHKKNLPGAINKRHLPPKWPEFACIPAFFSLMSELCRRLNLKENNLLQTRIRLNQILFILFQAVQPFLTPCPLPAEEGESLSDGWRWPRKK